MVDTAEQPRPNTPAIGRETPPVSQGRGNMWLFLGLGLVSTGICVVAVVWMGRTKGEVGAAAALILSAFIAGGVIGALVTGPGSPTGTDEGDIAKKSAWASRLGVFGTWLTGAAFALVVANGPEIAEWFSELTANVSNVDNGRHGSRLLQYGLGALLIAAAAGGFIFGAFQMSTNGRREIERAENAAKLILEAAKRNEAAATRNEAAAVANASAAAHTETVARLVAEGPPR